MRPHQRLLVHIGGARGVGKGTVLEYLSHNIAGIVPLTVVPVSALILQHGKEMFDRDWVELVDGEKENVRRLFVNELRQLPEWIGVLDSHYVDITPDGKILSIVPVELYPLIHCHVVIHCRTSMLLSRREQDTFKKRTLDRRLIERERRGELVIARRIARETRTPFHIVHNNECPGCAAKRLGDIITAQWDISSS